MVGKGTGLTSGGDGAAGFGTTYWTDLLQVQVSEPRQRRELLGKLLQRYWRPVYCYLRRRGCKVEQAKDLTQGFFHEVVLGRDRIEQADRSKGRFRSFLLAALRRYVVDEHRQATGATRGWRPDRQAVAGGGS